MTYKTIELKNDKKLQYLVGDATNPIGDEKKFIIHIVNNIGGWGSGFVVAISKKWNEPEAMYRKDYKLHKLGDIQFVKINNNLTVINMFAQDGVKTDLNPIPLKYNALSECLEKVNLAALRLGYEIHMPKIGSDRGGGNWDDIEHLIKNIITVNTYVYTLTK